MILSGNNSTHTVTFATIFYGYFLMAKKHNDNNELGDRLKKVRGEESQVDFGNRFALGRNTVIRYESGERTPEASLLKKICTDCDVSPMWLLLGEGPMLLSDLKKSGELDRELLEMAIHIVIDHEERKNIRLTARQKANTITILYEEAFENQSLRKAIGQQLEKKSIQERLSDKFRLLIETIKGR